MNLYDYLFSHVRKQQVAILSRKEQVTYEELLAQTENIADTLQQHGIQKGGRVGILADNSSFWIVSYLAILKLGAIAAPFPSRLTMQQCRTLSEIIQCSAFCIDSKHLSKYKSALPDQMKIITTSTPLASSPSYEHPVGAGKEKSTPAVAVRDEDLAALMFTSGSTGQPNAVKVSHGNIIANTESILSYLDVRADDKMLVVLPFDYSFGASLLHTHLRAGATLVINKSFLFIEDVIKDLLDFQCTSFAGVPTAYQHLLRRSSFAHHAFPHLRYVQQAGGKLANTFIKEFIALVPRVRFFVMYGQTEATARLSYLDPQLLQDKLGSIGRGIPGVTLEVLDQDGQPIQPEMEGELVAKGENIASGYWIPDPEKHNFRDGKLYTGDLASIDRDGFIYLTGRSSDFIKPDGHRISCKEIEDVLAEIPDIVEAAVIGIPDSERGETPKAFLVTKNNYPLPYEQVFNHCKGRLPLYAIPYEVEFLPDLPKNAAKKILKHILKERQEKNKEASATR